MSFQNKQWSFASVIGAAALVSVSVGAAIGLIVNHDTSIDRYAPVDTATRPLAGTTSAVPPGWLPGWLGSRSAAVSARATVKAAAPVGALGGEDGTAMPGTRSPFVWVAPVAALIAIPAALVAFLLSRAKSPEVELPLLPAMYVADGLATCASLPRSAPTPSAPTSTTASTMFTAAPTAGPDGLPPLISDPGLAVRYGHAGETFIATRGFLYIAGYIGTAGRTYL